MRPWPTVNARWSSGGTENVATIGEERQLVGPIVEQPDLIVRLRAGPDEAPMLAGDFKAVGILPSTGIVGTKNDRGRPSSAGRLAIDFVTRADHREIAEIRKRLARLGIGGANLAALEGRQVGGEGCQPPHPSYGL